MTRKQRKREARLQTVTHITIGLLMGLLLAGALFLPMILK